MGSFQACKAIARAVFMDITVGKMKPHDIAILCRNNKLLHITEASLRAFKAPDIPLSLVRR